MKVKRNRTKIGYTVLIVIGILFILIVTLLPFYLVFVNSFRTHYQILSGQTALFPTSLRLDNYIALFRVAGGVPFSTYISNSLIVGIGVGLLSTILACMAAYSLSHYVLFGKEAIGKILLMIYVFPTIILVVPVYELLSKIHLNDSHLGLILIHTTLVTPFCMWLLRSFFDSIPKEVEEAAFIDGATKWQSLLHIVLPLARPGLLTVFIYSLVFSWGEYTYALIMIDSSTKKTIPLGLAAYITSYGNIEWGRLLAGISLNVIPILIIFLLLSRTFLKGFTEGAIK
jgi:ABC-type glycerol-3-phosphate transport system permease component